MSRSKYQKGFDDAVKASLNYEKKLGRVADRPMVNVGLCKFLFEMEEDEDEMEGACYAVSMMGGGYFPVAFLKQCKEAGKWPQYSKGWWHVED